MDYQVWTKDEYQDMWYRHDCGDLAAARREIDKAVRLGADPVLTQELPYELSIKLVEVKVETKKGKAELDKGAGGEGHSEVRRGDKAAAEGLDQGSGHPGAGPGAGDKQ